MTRTEIDKVGQLSEPVRQMLERLDEEARLGNRAEVEQEEDSPGAP